MVVVKMTIMIHDADNDDGDEENHDDHDDEYGGQPFFATKH